MVAIAMKLEAVVRLPTANCQLVTSLSITTLTSQIPVVSVDRVDPELWKRAINNPPFHRNGREQRVTRLTGIVL